MTKIEISLPTQKSGGRKPSYKRIATSFGLKTNLKGPALAEKLKEHLQQIAHDFGIYGSITPNEISTRLITFVMDLPKLGIALGSGSMASTSAMVQESQRILEELCRIYNIDSHGRTKIAMLDAVKAKKQECETNLARVLNRNYSPIKIPADAKQITLQDLEAWNDKQYTIHPSGDKFSVVLVGESHYDDEKIQKQVELVKKTNPKSLLHEFLNAHLYNPKTGEYEMQDGRQEVVPEPPAFPSAIKDCADQENLRVIGCNPNLSEFQEAARDLASKNPSKFIGEELGDGDFYIAKRGDSDWSFDTFAPEYQSYREALMVDVIYNQLLKTGGPIVVVVGRDHANTIHEQGLLKKLGIPYAFVDQTQ